ncbi:hypothetical protein L211DRAFT_530801 [Terfezia boudieri ATCC MYA-4762]|uniref:MARVEL domain-containing protein n=1 Tax=Terfezia boudieri ATCC MYA-4762 TaxID=1051890 RepID=A0A3N4LBH2_9PEZI|nr:hypothetical protein L211DRAFT_530801 [Terfezia boudieri ATCC MYA-4762]
MSPSPKRTTSPNPFADPAPTRTTLPQRLPPKPIELQPFSYPTPPPQTPPPGRGYTPGGSLTTLRRRIPGKRTWSNIRLCLRFLSLLLSLSTAFAIAFVFYTFSRTRHHRWRDELLWPKHPQLIPTIYMLTASFVTVFVHIGLITSHYWDRERYLTEAYTQRDKISTVVQLGLGLVWIVGAVLPRVYREKRYGEGNDLWSWSCTEAWHGAGGGLVGRGGVKWGTFCRTFEGAYGSAALNALLEFLSVTTFSINTCVAKGRGYQTAPGH